MKTLYLECNMGAAGDMLTAALLELTGDKQAFLDRMNALGLPGVRVDAEPSVKCGITGTHMHVTIDGAEEEPGDDGHHSHEHEHHDDHDHPHDHDHHNHEHDHEHHHDHGYPHDHDHGHHHHASVKDIDGIIGGLDVSEKVKADARAVYALIADAESRVHGRPVTEIHFHEVGTMDAVADVVGVCLLMEALAPEQVIVSPVHTGSGQVRCAHGILPVPAPATALILEGIPSYGGQVKGELCTPTGAALLKHFADRFGNRPVMAVEAVGYGMGKKDFDQANCVRAFLGESEGVKETVTKLECNLDDMTGEDLGFAEEQLFPRRVHPADRHEKKPSGDPAFGDLPDGGRGRHGRGDHEAYYHAGDPPPGYEQVCPAKKDRNRGYGVRGSADQARFRHGRRTRETRI